MTELHQESALIHFLRAGILLAALIAVPGTAVCWNLIPKDLFQEERKDRPVKTAIDKDALNSENLVGFPCLETVERRPKKSSLSTDLDGFSSPDFFSREKEKSEPSNNRRETPIRVMKGSEDETAETAISSVISSESINWAVEEKPPMPIRNVSFGERLSPQRNFSALETQLKQLGAKYYRLEKWGSRGELFRFSCYINVTPAYESGDSAAAQPTCQQYFQAIDSDEIRVMERIVADIKSWKARRH